MTFPGQQPAQQQAPFDPFEQGGGVPAVSFKDAPLNSIVTILVDDDAQWLQSRDFESGELAYWPARPGEQPNPKMASVVTGVVQDTPWARQSGQVGERKSFWAGKPSSMFEAIKNAKAAHPGPDGKPGRITPGGQLSVAYVGETPNKDNPRLNNAKVYAAQYTPAPAGYGKPDAFEQGQPAQQAAPVQQGFPAQQAAAAPQFQQPVQQQAPVQQGFPAQQAAPVQQGGFPGQQAAPAQQGGFPGQQAQAPSQFQQPMQQQAPVQQGFPAQQAAPAQQGFPGQQAQAPTDPWAAQSQAPQGDTPPF